MSILFTQSNARCPVRSVRRQASGSAGREVDVSRVRQGGALPEELSSVMMYVKETRFIADAIFRPRSDMFDAASIASVAALVLLDIAARMPHTYIAVVCATWGNHLSELATNLVSLELTPDDLVERFEWATRIAKSRCAKPLYWHRTRGVAALDARCALVYGSISQYASTIKR